MKALVTGGGGFLGSAIVRKLLARGDEVRSFSRAAYPELEAQGAECVRGDLADGDAVVQAATGCDIIFHVAAKAGVWGPRSEYVRANVDGTRNVLRACGVLSEPRLVYTSTPSVTFAGEDQDGVDESAPYAASFLCAYPETKAQAERLVLEANDEQLATVALRPHLIWGPGDPHLVPRILERGRAGKLRLLGKRENKVDTIYVENAADAHVLAADRLQPGAPCAGNAYFLTNGEPVALEALLNKILAAGGVGPVTKHFPVGLAYALGAMLEGAYKLLGKRDEPPMTRFVARQLSTAHWFDISAARRDLGYDPAVSLRDGMKRLAESLAS